MIWRARHICLAAATAILGAAHLPFTTPATASGGVIAYNEWVHGSSLIGAPKYPADFPHFDYVNPDAPKGGIVRFSRTGTFDNFNIVVPRGTVPGGIGLIYDTLMTSSYDEVITDYGLIAEATQFPEEYSWVKFRLRENARWHDETPITPEDVIFSFDVFKEHNPNQSFYYRNVVKAEKTGEREVTFTFDQSGNRELPHIVGQLPILPKHYWEGTGANGQPRDITAGTLEPPLGSGPYRIRNFVAGRSISYERVEDYWAANLPVKLGKNNFDEIRFEYYRDTNVAFQAFFGDEYDWRTERRASNWATGYNVPPVERGWIKKEMFDVVDRGGMSGFLVNLRREKFQDWRVRRALSYAFNFEEMNDAIFFGQYERVSSFFHGTELASSGSPGELELEILEAVRGQVPEDVFNIAFENPVGGDRRAMRENFREAIRLFEEAGYELRDGVMVDGRTGEPFTIEFLIRDPAFERVAIRYRDTLSRIGVDMSVRSVDTPQYVNRARERNFDMIYLGWAQSLSPGNEQRDFFGSEAADRSASRNWIGIQNPAVDKLIDRLIFAENREELIAATRALDRVLLWNHYVIPGWTLTKDRVAYWNRFGRPDPLPKYNIGFPDIWWWDEEKAARIVQERGSR